MKSPLFAAAFAVTLSLVTHAAVILVYRTTPNEVSLDGAPPVTAAFGSAFADLVTGSTGQPEVSETITVPPQITSAAPPKVAQPVNELRRANEINRTAATEALRSEALAQSSQLRAVNLAHSPREIVPAEPESPATALPNELDNRAASAAALVTVEVANERNQAEPALAKEIKLPSSRIKPYVANMANIRAATTTKGRLLAQPDAIPVDVQDEAATSAPKAEVQASALPKTPRALQPAAPGPAVPARPPSQAPTAASKLVSTQETTVHPQLKPRQNADPVIATTAPQTEDPVETPKMQPRPKPARASLSPTTGNAKKNIKRGQDEARDDGSAAKSGQGESVASLTRAQTRAATKWERQVLGKILRARRKLPRVRALAVVDFQITPKGTIARIRIHRSSGNADFDRLALDHVRRAAPFPPPPFGAQTRLGVEVEGRR